MFWTGLFGEKGVVLGGLFNGWTQNDSCRILTPSNFQLSRSVSLSIILFAHMGTPFTCAHHVCYQIDIDASCLS